MWHSRPSCRAYCPSPPINFSSIATRSSFFFLLILYCFLPTLSLHLFCTYRFPPSQPSSPRCTELSNSSVCLNLAWSRTPPQFRLKTFGILKSFHRGRNSRHPFMFSVSPLSRRCSAASFSDNRLLGLLASYQRLRLTPGFGMIKSKKIYEDMRNPLHPQHPKFDSSKSCKPQTG